METRRVVVTGIGALSCLGLNVKDTWEAVTAGRCGIQTITKMDLTQYRTKIGGVLPGFDPLRYVSEKDARHLDEFCIFAIAAADEALLDSGLGTDFHDGKAGVDPNRAGCCIGTGIGGIRSLEVSYDTLRERGPHRVSPFTIPQFIVNMGSGITSIRYGMKGPNFAVVTACATGSHSIGEACDQIRLDRADVMLCGGAESPISQLGYSGFGSLHALSTRNDDPQHASRPFDKDRDGFVMSEGAGVLVLEELEHAKKRGAKIYAEIAGYGATGDGFHMTAPAPDGEGGVRAIQMALREAGMNPEEIDYINAHGTSTSLNDKYETAAIKTVFGEYARKVALSSTKGGTGHTLGAAGGLETIFCLKAMETGIIPPTINYTTPDPECDLDYTPNTARQKTVRTALNINLGFGGQNGVIIVKKY